MESTFRIANLKEENDAKQLGNLLSMYAIELGDNQITDDTASLIIRNLIKWPTSTIYFVELDTIAIGFAICFYGFSTFKNRKLLNIHDFYITGKYQNNGIGSSFMKYIEVQAQNNGCCKLTLEVYSHNAQAIKVYEKNGFQGSNNKDGNEVIYALFKVL